MLEQFTPTGRRKKQPFKTIEVVACWEVFEIDYLGRYSVVSEYSTRREAKARVERAHAQGYPNVGFRNTTAWRTA